jgi:hypothetical protein
MSLAFTPNAALVNWLSSPTKGAFAVLGFTAITTGMQAALARSVPDNKEKPPIATVVSSAVSGAIGSALMYYIIISPTRPFSVVWFRAANPMWRRLVLLFYFMNINAAAVASLAAFAPGDTSQKAGIGAGAGLAMWVISAAIFHKYIEPLSLSNEAVAGGLVKALTPASWPDYWPGNMYKL